MQELTHSPTQSDVNLRSALSPRAKHSSSRSFHQLSTLCVTSVKSVQINDTVIRVIRAVETPTRGVKNSRLSTVKKHAHGCPFSNTDCTFVKRRLPCLDEQGLALELIRVRGGSLCILLRGSM